MDYRKRGMEIENLRHRFTQMVRHHDRFLSSVKAAEQGNMPLPTFEGETMTFDCFGAKASAAPRFIKVDDEWEVEYRFEVRWKAEDESTMGLEVCRLYANTGGGLARNIRDAERICDLQNEAVAWYVAFYVVEGVLASNLLNPSPAVLRTQS